MFFLEWLCEANLDLSAIARESNKTVEKQCLHGHFFCVPSLWKVGALLGNGETFLDI